jgi:N-acetyl-anhydromuramyl-L-alanine amidase AmpD
MKKNKLIAFGIIFVVIIVAIFLFFTLKDKKTKVVFQAEENAAPNIAVENNLENETEKTGADIKSGQKEIPEEKLTEVSEKKTDESDFKIINNLVSWGFENSSGRKIDTIVIHSSYNALGGDEYDFKKLLSEYKEYGVSPHYVIDRSGNVYRLVAEKNIAYHAGESKAPDGRAGVNNFSIGIEILENKTDGPSAAQYVALKNLIADIKTGYKIKYILGHNQIAPGRKDDPWNFDWKKI